MGGGDEASITLFGCIFYTVQLENAGLTGSS